MRRTAFLAALLAAAAQAHLLGGSLKPAGGATYHPGDKVTLTWGVDIPHHEGIDVYFSADGGKTWTPIASNLADETKTGTYKWTVPATATTQGKWRVCQTERSPKCTDADNRERPSGPPPYVLIDGPFTIASATAVASPALDPAPSLRAAGPGTVELSFTLSVGGPVRLAAYDAAGREAAVLLTARYPAGTHRLSLFSGALKAHAGWMLRLTAEGKTAALLP